MKVEIESVIIAGSMQKKRMNNFTNRKMRGNDYMSASDKKKLRKEMESAVLTEKQQAQQKEDKQLKNYTMTFVVVMILVVAIAVSSMGISWWNTSGIPARNTVAVTFGDTALSNADLSYYYMDTINKFYGDAYDQYTTYASLFISMNYGLDISQPLSAQVYNETTGETWADYFIDSAIASAKTTYALYNEAMNGGEYKLPEDFETQVNASLASTRALAGLYGFSSMNDYLKAMYGNGADEESYVNYYRVNAIAEAYYAEYYEGLEYTVEEISDYNKEHFNDFSSFSYSYFYVPVSKYLPQLAEGAEYTDAQRADAEAAAKAAADKLATAQDGEAFEALIDALPFAIETTKAEVITKTTYASTATLYRDWIADANRKAGETSVFTYESNTDKDEVLDGYYVVLFQGRDDHNTLLRSARHMLVKFTGGTKNEEGVVVYTDAQKAEFKAKADRIYNEWLTAGKLTSETFAAKVSAETSDDAGSNTNGGLYEDIFKGQMVENFDAWVFDPARQPGDHGIIETELGYHIMYFVGEQDNTYRDLLIENTLRNADLEEWYKALIETVTVTEGDTSYMNEAIIIANSAS